MVFYVHAGVCGLILALWAYNFSDEPYRHPFVSDKEFKKISIGKAPKVVKYNPPYKKIFSTPVIWGIYVATAANFLVAQFAVTYTPIYLVYVSGIRLSFASIIAAIPLIIQFIFKCLAGTLSDRIHFISDLWKIRIFNTIAFWGSAALLIICGIIPDSNKMLSTIILIAAVGLLGFNAGGFTKCTVIVAKQFSPTVMAVMQVIMCLALFSGSFLVPNLTPNGTKEQYNVVFYIYGACLIIGNIVFCVLAKGEAAEWTKPVITENTPPRNNFVARAEPLESIENPRLPRNISHNDSFTTATECPETQARESISKPFRTVSLSVPEPSNEQQSSKIPPKPDLEQIDDV